MSALDDLVRRAVPPAASVVVELRQADLDGGLPALATGAADCIVLADPLASSPDPLALLRSVRAALRPGGAVVLAVANAAHHSVVRQLLRGDLPQPSPVLPATYASAFKLLLEAGFAPDIAGDVEDRGGDDLTAAAAPLLAALGVGAAQADRHLNAKTYVLTGRALEVATAPARPLSVVACTNDAAQLANNLLASPWLHADGAGARPHEVLLYEGMATAAEGLNRGIDEAVNDLVVLVHQDVYLPSWWPQQLAASWREAAAAGELGVGAAFGVRYREEGDRVNVGHVVDRDHLLAMESALPADVDGIDEMVMVVPRATPLRFDPALGWHLYGTDFALQAHARDLRVAVLDIPCFHNSLLSGLDEAYARSEDVLAAKWPSELPIVTNSTTIVRREPAPEILDEHAGYCPCCRSDTTFKVWGERLRDAYICATCGSIPRQRHLQAVLDREFPGWERLSVHESSPGNDFISRYCPDYTSSQFFDDVPRGESRDGVRREDLEALTFADDSFDLFLTQDVLEHVFRPDRAIAEIQRVVKPGGAHVFTAPTNKGLLESRPRARLLADGTVDHLLDAEYRGNPIGDNRSLVTYDYGDDFERLLSAWSGVSVEVVHTVDRSRGLDAEHNEVFVIRKPRPEPPRPRASRRGGRFGLRARR